VAVTVNMHEAKTQLSRLVERARLGEEVIIAKAGKPVARIVPIATDREARTPGSAVGLLKVSPDFHEPLPEDVVSEFEG
jgi:prevent-host-death family protein